jgi:hypothetical protein
MIYSVESIFVISMLTLLFLPVLQNIFIVLLFVIYKLINNKK